MGFSAISSVFTSLEFFRHRSKKNYFVPNYWLSNWTLLWNIPNLRTWSIKVFLNSFSFFFSFLVYFLSSFRFLSNVICCYFNASVFFRSSIHSLINEISFRPRSRKSLSVLKHISSFFICGSTDVGPLNFFRNCSCSLLMITSGSSGTGAGLSFGSITALSDISTKSCALKRPSGLNGYSSSYWNAFKPCWINEERLIEPRNLSWSISGPS